MIWVVLALENLFFPFGAAAVLLKFFFSPRRAVLSNLSNELRERFGGDAAPPGTFWFHAASAGEVNAARPLMAGLKKASPKIRVLVTALTRAGRGRARELPEVDFAAFAPLDCWPAVTRFLDNSRPRALLLVETEIWPHLIALAAARGIPVLIVNGRISERSFARYRLIAPLLRPFLAKLSLVAAQTEADAARFRALGARDVFVAGNLKYDVPSDATEAFRPPWTEPFFVAASTHPVEEEAVVDAWLAARKKEPGLKLILAPRHPERAAQAAGLLEARGVAYTRATAPLWPADCLLVDRLGVLRGLYRGALACFVGGTLVPVGGHSLIEPALAGVPVVFGPHTEHTREAAERLESAGAGLRVGGAENLAAVLGDLLKDRARAQARGALAQKTAQGLQGAARRTLDRLGGLLG